MSTSKCRAIVSSIDLETRTGRRCRSRFLAKIAGIPPELVNGHDSQVIQAQIEIVTYIVVDLASNERLLTPEMSNKIAAEVEGHRESSLAKLNG